MSDLKLGQILDDTAQRDAIHDVVAINYRGARLVSEQRVEWCETKAEAASACERLKERIVAA